MGASKALVNLLRHRSVELGSFKLASGATSPYYIDARRTTMSAAGLELVGRLGLDTLRLAGWEPRFIGGLTLGADPVAYAIAIASRSSPPAMDAFTVRKQAKRHGRRQQIEGCFEMDAPVVIVEDVLTTGRSALQAADVVAHEGGHVLGVLAVVDRDEGGRAAVEAAGLPLRTLVTVDDLGLR